MHSEIKGKLVKEIESMPENMMPRFYRILKLLKDEMIENKQKTNGKSTLRGIWKGSHVNDKMIESAKKSIFPYQDPS